MPKELVTYGEGRQVAEYDNTVPPTDPAFYDKATARNSTAVMLEAGLPPEEAAALARDEYEVLNATGQSDRTSALEFADAEKIRSDAIAQELAEYDPTASNASETLQTLGYMSAAHIDGEPLSYTLPRVYKDLGINDKFNRLDGVNNDAIMEREEFVTRLNSAELDYREQAQIDIQNLARERASSGGSVRDVFDSFVGMAENSDDVLDGGFLRDLAIMMVPFVTQANLEMSYEEFTGRNVPVSTAVFTGEVLNMMKEELVSTPPAARQERATQLVQILKKNSGFSGILKKYLPDSLDGFIETMFESDAETYFNILALNDTNFLEDGGDWARWLDNAFAVFDFASVGMLKSATAKPTNQLHKGERATALRAKASTDGAADAEEILAIAATDTSGRINPAIGMREEDHIGALLPNVVTEEGYDLLPDYTQKLIERNDALAGEVINRRTRRAFFNNTEDQFVRDTVDKFNRELGGNLQPTRSQIGEISETEDSFQYVAQFGADKDSGFKTAEEALTFVRTRLGVDAPNQVLKHDPATGKYYKRNEGPTTGVEYVVRYPTKLYIPNEAADTFDPTTGLGAFGVNLVKNNWIANAATKYDSQIRFAATRSVDDASFVHQKLSDILRPFDQLKRKDQQVVIDIENYGAEQAMDFTPAQLATMTIDGKNLTTKQINGYYSRLQTRRAMWEVENRALYEKMKSRNMKLVEADDFKGAGSIVAREDVSGGTWAYSTSSKQQTKLTKAQTEALYNNGGSVVKLWRPIVVDNTEVTHVIVDGAVTRLKELPQSVLRYVPGYNPRYYDATWFVRRKTKLIRNGEEVETAVPVAAGRSYKEAQEMVARQTDPENYVVDADKVSANGLADSESLNFELDNMMFYNSRSDMEIAALGGANIVVDPVEALRRSVATVSQTLGQSRLREVMMEKFLRTYSKVLPKDVRGNPVYPGTKNQILLPKVGDTEAMKQYRDARSMYDYIKVLTHGMDDGQKLYKNLMLNAAAAMEKKGSPGSIAASNAIRGLTEEFSPTYLLRTMAFTTQILTAPLRQAWIQSHQALFLTGLDPALTLRSFVADGFYLDTAFWMDRANVRQNKWTSAVAKAAKTTAGIVQDTKEMENLYKNFQSSGMPYLRAALQLEGLNDSFRHTLGEVGYALGERHNLAATYAFAYRKYLKDNNKKWNGLTDKDWETIAHKTREYSLNMTRADAFNYQHGIFSAATQYLAIRHKALNAVLASEEFTPAQRLRIMAGQLVMFGAEGAGIGMIANSIIDNMGLTYEPVDGMGATFTAADVKKAVEGGIYDLIANTTMQALIEQDMESDTQFSRSMAALGEADRFIATAFTAMDSIDVMDFAMGPSASVPGNAQRVYRELKTLLHTELDTEQKSIRAVESVATLFSSGSNIVKGRVGAMLSVAVDSKGRPIAETTPIDNQLRRLFGFSTAQESEYYERLREGGSVPKNKQAEVVDEIADVLATMVRREVLRGNLNEAKAVSAAVFTMWDDPMERAAILEAFQNKLSVDEIANVELYGKLVEEWDVLTSKETATKLLNDSYMIRNPETRARLKAFIEQENQFGSN